MNETVTVRQATVADIQALARLWVITFPDKFGPILGDKAERVIGDWLRINQSHLQHTAVAEIKGIVTGFIILETPATSPSKSGRLWWYVLQRHHGIFGTVRSFMLMVLINHNRQWKPGEVYIEMLGVAPAWRGEGLAAQLIAYAETIAHQAEVRQLTLSVVCSNAAAIKLYKKMGFEITLEQQNRVLKWLTGHSGYFEMVKQLPG